MATIHGDITGIRKSILKRLETLYEFEISRNEIITLDLAQVLLSISDQIQREIAIYLNRHGRVTSVAVGDIRTVGLPELNGRRGQNRLSGIRCIHTHPNSSSALSELDIASLREMHFDLIAALSTGPEGKIDASYAYITKIIEDETDIHYIGPVNLDEFIKTDFTALLLSVDHRAELMNTVHIAEKESALLAGIEQTKTEDIRLSLDELEQLAQTAGAIVVGKVWQKRDRPDPVYYLGRGKIEEIKFLRQTKQANMIIFDDELSPTQQRNLEESLGIKVLDRTALILDIFAQRARSYEGKLQVALAQMRYNLPRLGGQGLVLSRLGGGIGTRGPGETKLEIDRRRIRSRIAEIEKAIEELKQQRTLHRQRRQNEQKIAVALVGYTNAGKSTLLNALTAAGVMAEDKLFATLDPTTRRAVLPDGQEILITDTVGFIQKLPHQLIAAFRATLEEVVQSDLLIHVVDAAHPGYQRQTEAVFQVLKELQADTKPVITAFNKIDSIDSPYQLERLLRQDNSVGISALSGQGIERLLQMVQEYLYTNKQQQKRELLLPYDQSGLLATLYKNAAVHKVQYCPEGIRVIVSLPLAMIDFYQTYVLQGDE
ncbi:gtpase hflx [Lucifera butyrica]|uniref:GTPase HflX n=1 Tax=Lucifera butyrica TaxID=1351585 RepID=A0A498R0F4_9FIRM|nr:GTPase HflX [Lucifera butyrica]VBB05986.1 gtpase hflx [Lucifera butyrica]